MAFHHRKLLNPSYINPNITESCSEACDPDENSTGICPVECINVCYHICNLPPPPLPPPTMVISTAAHHKTLKLSIYFTIPLAILATAFFIFICYTVYKLYTCWYNSRRRRRLERLGPDQEPGPDELLDENIQGPVVDHHVWYIRTVGLQPSVISKISVVKYKKGDGLIDGTDCSVCLNEFEEDEMLRLLPKCNHAFHIPCIDTWLRSHTNCPMCRAGIVISTVRAVEEEDVIVRNLGQVEEARIGDPGSVNQAPEIRIGLEEEDNDSRAQAQLGPKIDDDGVQVQPMRRSISLDSLSARAINSAVANAFSGRDLENRTFEAKSPLNELSGQIGSSSVKRSLSCSAKVFLSRYNSRNRNSEA